MAKQTERSYVKGNRQKDIDNCKQCNGAPTPESFNLQGMCGLHCSICMNVISWQKVGQAITIDTKKKIPIEGIGASGTKLEINLKSTPGVGIQFGELKIE